MGLRTKTFLFMVITLCLATVLTTMTTTMASPDPSVYIDPANNSFTRSSPLGTQFTVSIKTADWVSPAVFSYQLKVFFNTTMLNVTTAEMPVGHWLTPSNPTKIFVVDAGFVDYEAGSVSFAATLLSPELPKTGGGTLGTITFKIIAIPESGQNFSSLIELKDRDTKMVDSSADEIPKASYDKISGNYQYSAVAPPTTGGDLNADGVVDIADIAIWGVAFGSTPTSTRWDPRADMDNDGEVNIIDAVLIAQNWTG